MNKKMLVITLAALALIGGAYLYPKKTPSITVGTSPVGTEFGTAKIASINFSLASHLATSTSIFNNSQQDRIIKDTFVACDTVGTSKTAYTGAGLANLIIRIATTTTNSPAIVSNTNYIGNYTAVATTSPVVYTASSTEGVITGYSRVWPSQTYLTFSSNATNTAQCTVGASYLAR
jgi:hypothetical protein